MQDRWDLVVSASWIDADTKSALEYLSKKPQSTLTTNELLTISKIAPLDVYDPRVQDIQSTIRVEHEPTPLREYRFFNTIVDKAYIVTSKLQVDHHLLRSLWETVADMWRAGRRRIESQDLLGIMESKGETVRSYAMDRIFTYLFRSNCIKGRQYVDPDGLKRHGATTITWVDRNCHAVQFVEDVSHLLADGSGSKKKVLGPDAK